MKRVFNFGARVMGVLFATIATANAQTSQLRFDASRVPEGTVMHYKKSGLDGSRPTHVSVYVVDGEHLESLKWDDDAAVATLVTARMDWRRFSIREFQSLRLERGKPPEPLATLVANAAGTQLQVSFLPGKVITVNHWPWHSYDFDFVSLALVLPHVRNPEGDLIFWRTDVIFSGEGMGFAEVGGIRLHYEAMELHESKQVRRYSIGGAGLEHRYGALWTDATTGLLIEYQIPLGDEPGFKDVHLRLAHDEKMTAAQWTAFKKAKVDDR
jgi:hypothetical protein